MKCLGSASNNPGVGNREYGIGGSIDESRFIIIEAG